MKRAILGLALLVSGLAAAATGSEILPSMTHPTWVRSYDRAAEAYTKQQYNKALAFLSGGLYESGVTVSLDTSTCPAEVDKVNRAARRAYEAWTKALGPDCPIRLLANDQAADLKIVVVKAIPKEGDALGLIDMKKSFAWGVGTYRCTSSGTINILTRFEGTRLDDDELTEVICHEMGHLLGLADLEHTGFLMGPLVRHESVTAPTPDETQAVLTIRRHFRAMIEEIRDQVRKAS